MAINRTQDDVWIPIHDYCKNLLITGPSALRTMAQMLHEQFHPCPGVSTSLNISHETPSDGRHPKAADHIKYPGICNRSLAYLQGTSDGEVRDWTQTAFLPHAVFRRIAHS